MEALISYQIEIIRGFIRRIIGRSLPYWSLMTSCFMRKAFYFLFFCLLSFLTACQSSAPVETVAPQPAATTTAIPLALSPTPFTAPTAEPLRLGMDARVPSELVQAVSAEVPEIHLEGDSADFQFTLVSPAFADTVAWVYALAAPFPTVVDGVTGEQLKSLWLAGDPIGDFSTLLVDKESRDLLTYAWGVPSAAVSVMNQADMADKAWEERTALAILPFEDLTPRWKVLAVDGVSPYDQEFDAAEYVLSFYFGWQSAGTTAAGDVPWVDLAWTNRDPDRFTSLIITGTTALVRYTAQRMEENGVNYPAEQIGAILRSADLTHASNEVSFDPNCPPADPVRTEMRFCSNPSYYELLDTVGVDLVELTGNHLIDWGVEPFVYTLDMYVDRGMPYYGGGYNLEDATRPLKIENHGNRLAFLGCNRSGPDNDWATETTAGSAPCDLDAMEAQIHALLAEGYLPIVTFQHYEVDDFMPMNLTKQEFQRISAAGAVIVSGSQAHFPHGFAFVDDHFIHYGLGNLFFDQMFQYNRREFIDRHIFYNGKYLGVELITAELEDYAQPRLMTADERSQMLADYFSASGW
jgi:hypothetical protein